MKKKTGIIIIFLICMGLSGCINTETPNDEEGTVEYWTWVLSAGELVNVTFTDQMIDCTGSNKTEELFASILNITDEELVIFQEYPYGDWTSWISSRPVNELEYIQPDIPCSVHVEKNCTLCIEKC